MAFLRVEGVSKKFGGLVAVDGVTFSVSPQQIKAIIGPNGAGKTTLFNIISGFLSPDSGKVFFQGREITRVPPYQRSHLGLARTFQNTLLFEEMTVEENVMVAQGSSQGFSFWEALLKPPSSLKKEKMFRERAREVMNLFGLFPLRDKKAKDLTAGQRRLLEMARALSLSPRILLLDEPAAGLNPKEREELKKVIQRIRGEGITILLVEHDMGLVMEISDEVVVLDEGKKIAEGPPLLVKEDERVIEAYLGGEI